MKRTQGQNDFFMKICRDFGEMVGYTPQEMKEVLVYQHFGDKRSTSALDTKEMHDLIETSLMIAAENGLVYDIGEVYRGE